jgi:hypothetical protein
VKYHEDFLERDIEAGYSVENATAMQTMSPKDVDVEGVVVGLTLSFREGSETALPPKLWGGFLK